MKFDKDISLIQQKMSETSIGIARRQNILKELNIEGGQTIMDVGCGGGQLVEAISLGVGVNGKAIGVDPSETQIVSAKDRCQSFENTEFLCCYADNIDMDDASCDSITSTQTLEYIEDVDAALNEIRRLLKNHSRFVNISTLWDYFGFHGPDKELNSLMHEVVKGQKHPMLPTKLNGKLEKLGFKNIRTHEIPFFITKRDENSFAKFHEINMVNAALKKGISENQVDQWRKQLHQAEQEGSFAFTSFAIMTTGYINQ